MTIIQYVVARACEKFQHNGNIFNTAGFQSELSRVADSRPMITSDIAVAILLSTPGVNRDAAAHWRYKGDGAIQ
jgi:hypothetical protein